MSGGLRYGLEPPTGRANSHKSSVGPRLRGAIGRGRICEDLSVTAASDEVHPQRPPPLPSPRSSPTDPPPPRPRPRAPPTLCLITRHASLQPPTVGLERGPEDIACGSEPTRHSQHRLPPPRPPTYSHTSSQTHDDCNFPHRPLFSPPLRPRRPRRRLRSAAKQSRFLCTCVPAVVPNRAITGVASAALCVGHGVSGGLPSRRRLQCRFISWGRR